MYACGRYFPRLDDYLFTQTDPDYWMRMWMQQLNAGSFSGGLARQTLAHTVAAFLETILGARRTLFHSKSGIHKRVSRLVSKLNQKEVGADTLPFKVHYEWMPAMHTLDSPMLPLMILASHLLPVHVSGAAAAFKTTPEDLITRDKLLGTRHAHHFNLIRRHI